jgi:hypothetical protein
LVASPQRRRAWFATVGEMQAVSDDRFAGITKPQAEQKEQAELQKNQEPDRGLNPTMM